MEPYQSPTPQSNPYDFITDPQQPKRSRFGGGDSIKKKLIVVIAGALFLIIATTVVMSLFSAASSSVDNSLKALMAEQEEIIRVADLGAKDALSSDTRALASTTKLSLTTQQSEFKTYLESRKIKLSKEELAAKKDGDTDKLLEDSKTSNRYDEVFIESLSRMLATYANRLESTYNEATGERVKSVLRDSYSSTANLIKS